MQKVRFVGLDVHKESIAIAIADSDGSAPETVATIPNETKLLIKRLKALGQLALLRCCYEAGPTGFVLHRSLRDAGIDCIVIAPSLVPKRAGDRVKTDRRDAVKLARFLRSGDLTEVHVPEASTEAMRDLERSRDDAKRAERTSRHQLSKFLLRHGRRYEGKTAWTGMHLDWARGQTLAHEALNRVLVDYVQAVENATARVDRLTQDIAELVEPRALIAPSTLVTLVAPNVISVSHWDRLARGELYAATRRIPWRQLLRRTFDVDLQNCAACGGRLRVIGAVVHPWAARRILKRLGLPARAPPIARTRDATELQGYEAATTGDA